MGDRARALLLGAALVAATCVAYSPVWDAGFVFDDSWYITGNPAVQAPDGLRRFWLTTELPDYYPLTWSLWWLEWRLWGPAPRGYHVVNVALHAAAALLLAAVLRRLRVPGAWWAAAAFALHPLGVASAAWVSEQKNTLALVFYLAAIFFYIQFDDGGGRRFYVLSVVAFLAALLSKTAVVMMPVVLLGGLIWRRGRLTAQDLGRTAPFFVLALGLGLVTVWFQHHRALGGEVTFHESIAERFVRAGAIPWFYLGKTLWPAPLMAVYPKWTIETADPRAYLPGLALAAAAALAVWKRRTWGGPALLGFGYFIVMLFPVLGFVDQGFYQHAWVADPWVYFAMPGVLALVAAGAAAFCQRKGGLAVRAGAVAGLVALAGLGVLTFRRCHVYESDETLWADTLARNPHAALAHNNLGFVRAEQGRWDEAIAHYEAALGLQPDLAQAHNNLGVALSATARVEEALSHYTAAVRQRPRYTAAEVNRGNTLLGLGRLQEASSSFERVLELDPGSADAHNGLAGVRALQDRTEDAVAHYATAVRLRPDFATAVYNLAILLDDLGRYEEAVPAYEAAVRLMPDAAHVRHDLANALVRAGRVQPALTHFESAARLAPENAAIQNDWADARARLGR